MDLAVIVAIDFVYAIATLALISLGLAIVFGMMRLPKWRVETTLRHGLPSKASVPCVNAQGSGISFDEGP
jgi:hypothetical protein